MQETYRHVDSDLLVTANAEGTDSVPCGRVARLGSRAELLEHLSSTGKTITRLADTAIDDHLGHSNLAHDMFFGHCCLLTGIACYRPDNNNLDEWTIRLWGSPNSAPTNNFFLCPTNQHDEKNLAAMTFPGLMDCI